MSMWTIPSTMTLDKAAELTYLNLHCRLRGFHGFFPENEQMNEKNINGLLNRDVTHVILESISDGVFTIDYNWRITSFNRAAEKITGVSKEEAVGRHCWDVFRSNMCELGCALKRTM